MSTELWCSLPMMTCNAVYTWWRLSCITSYVWWRLPRCAVVCMRLEFSLCTNILQVPRQDMNLCTNVFIVSAEGFELKFYPKPDTSPAAHEGRALSASASAVVRRHSSELCPSLVPPPHNQLRQRFARRVFSLNREIKVDPAQIAWPLTSQRHVHANEDTYS